MDLVSECILRFLRARDCMHLRQNGDSTGHNGLAERDLVSFGFRSRSYAGVVKRVVGVGEGVQSDLLLYLGYTKG